MSVSVSRTWRDAQAEREGKKVAKRWLVTIIVQHKDGGAKERVRTVVGEGTPLSHLTTQKKAEQWGHEEFARLLAAGPKTKREAAERLVRIANAPTETVSKWWGRYLKAAEEGRVGRKNKGRPQAAIGDRRTRFRLHIEPVIGHLDMRDPEMPRYLREIVEHLDDQIRARVAFYESGDDEERSGWKPGMSWKSGAHVWSEITSGFREACGSKLRELRIEGLTDPTVNVMAPIKTDDRLQHALYPAEAIKLISCEAIPLSRRRLYAVAMYTGMRLSEMGRLTAEHIEFEHDRINVPGEKSRAALRRTRIEPALRPLLKKLVKERPSGPLLDVLPDHGKCGYSWYVQRDLETAQITRKDLFRDDAHVRPYTGHAHRHTAITWACVVNGRDDAFLKSNYGHTSDAMTRQYLDDEHRSRKTYGTPFPALPASLLGGGVVVPLHTRSA
jgi:integrase